MTAVLHADWPARDRERMPLASNVICSNAISGWEGYVSEAAGESGEWRPEDADVTTSCS